MVTVGAQSRQHSRFSGVKNKPPVIGLVLQVCVCVCVCLWVDGDIVEEDPQGSAGLCVCG